MITKNGFSKGRKAQTEQKYNLDIIYVSSLGHVLPVNMAQGDLYCPVSPGHHPIADNSRHGCIGKAMIKLLEMTKIVLLFTYFLKKGQIYHDQDVKSEIVKIVHGFTGGQTGLTILDTHKMSRY